MPTEKSCKYPECGREARMAVRTIDPKGMLQTIAYYDDRLAPKTATPYCKKHGVELVRQALVSVVSDD